MVFLLQIKSDSDFYLSNKLIYINARNVNWQNCIFEKMLLVSIQDIFQNVSKYNVY